MIWLLFCAGIVLLVGSDSGWNCCCLSIIKQWLHTIIVVTVFFFFSLSYCCSITVVPIFPHHSPLPCPHPHIDLAYKWNLVSKTNKQAKQNQRRGNKEQIDSNQRGRGRGEMGGRRGRVKDWMWMNMVTVFFTATHCSLEKKGKE